MVGDVGRRFLGCVVGDVGRRVFVLKSMARFCLNCLDLLEVVGKNKNMFPKMVVTKW